MKKYEQLSDDQLDNLFREAESELSVPEFNPVFWNEVAAMIPVADVPEKKRRKALYFYLLGIALLTFGLGMYFSQFETVNLNSITLKNNLDSTELTKISEKQNTSSTLGNELCQSTTNETIKLNTTKNTALNIEKFVEYMLKANDYSFQTNYIVYSEIDRKLKEEEETYLLPRNISFVQNEIALVAINSNMESKFDNKKINIENEISFDKGWFTQTAFGIANNNPINGSSRISGVSRLGIAHQWINKSSLFYTGVLVSGDFAKNILREQKFIGSNGSQTTVEHSYKAIYGVEFPLSFSYIKKKSSFGFVFTPGVQVFYKGKETIYENNSFVRSGNSNGVIPSKSSLTMQVGLQYRRLLTKQFSINGSFNAYTLRPFNSQDFIGTYKKLPVNGTLGVSFHF